LNFILLLFLSGVEWDIGEDRRLHSIRPAEIGENDDAGRPPRILPAGSGSTRFVFTGAEQSVVVHPG
jgi:hypothetical protein